MSRQIAATKLQNHFTSWLEHAGYCVLKSSGYLPSIVWSIRLLEKCSSTQVRGRAVIQIIAVLIGGAFIWWWMHRYCHPVIVQVRQHYNNIATNRVHYALVLGTMMSNALIATSFVQAYYRVFFL
jgi:hypothetical protein